jgi:hypothetical protein
MDTDTTLVRYCGPAATPTATVDDSITLRSVAVLQCNMWLMLVIAGMLIVHYMTLVLLC